MDPGAPVARFGGMTAGYESFYLRAAAPSGGQGFWLRHTVRIAPGEHPTGSLWLTWFDAVRGPTATKLTVPGPEAGEGGLGHWLQIGGATLGEGRAVGAIAEAPNAAQAQWDLSFTGERRLEHLVPEWLYAAPLPRTKPTSLHPFARFAGSVSIGGEHHDIDDWPGMVGHNWGAQHAERWIWLHGMHFDGAGDDTWIDVALGRVRAGPVLLPWLASGAISLRGDRIPLGGIGRFPRLSVAERPTGALLRLPGPAGMTVRVEVGAPRERFVGWNYADPDGRTHDVANCSIAGIELTVRSPSGPGTVLSAAGTAAYELGMREVDHGITIQPFADAPRGAPEPPDPPA
ncbi:hypothetical protein [Intrasporangium sp. DVR]|uniref:hypothetical protein n=1 Tax=Intrasporangium sp. DVR TaxID=3127867 RepID=UPI00313A4EC8